MNIKHLMYYLQVCHDKNISKASKNLFISQQGLSKAIRNLEEYVQAPLFYRDDRELEMTEYGIYFYEQAEKIVREHDLLLENIYKMTNRNKGKVRVVFSYGVLNGLSSELILSFQETYPNIELIVSEYPDRLAEEMLWKEEADIALSIAPIDESKFDSTTIFTRDICAVVNEKNPLSKKEEIDFADLQNEKIIVVSDDFKMYHSFIDKCQQAGIEPSILLRTAEIMNIHKLPHLNKGVGISVEFVIQDIDYPNIYSIPFKDKSYVWEVCVLTKKGRYLSPPAKTFLKYVLNW